MGRGGGKGGRGGRGGPMTRDVQVSKKLSWLLRHGAEQEGLKLGEGGYLSLQDVLQNRNLRSLKVSFDEIRQIVADNEKQRFTLLHISEASSSASNGTTAASKPLDEPADDVFETVPNTSKTDDDPANWLIRANQGHSLKVDDAGLLTPITIEAGNLPAVVVHGTRRENWKKIVQSGGLKPMGRNHVHFATGVPEALASQFKQRTENAAGSTDKQDVETLPDKKDMPVTLSGMRNSSTILMYLDLEKALKSGISFGLSDNGVVLSEGDKDGLVRLELFDLVLERGGDALVKEGSVVGELKGAK